MTITTTRSTRKGSHARAGIRSKPSMSQDRGGARDPAVYLGEQHRTVPGAEHVAETDDVWSAAPPAAEMTDRFAALMAASGLDVVSLAILIALNDDAEARKVHDPDESWLVEAGLCLRVRQRGGVPTTALTQKGRKLAVELRNIAKSSGSGKFVMGIAQFLGRRP